MSERLRLLLVEDVADDAELVLRELHRGGYELEYERIESESQMRAALRRQTWDLVISDHVLPQFSGPAALQLLQESGVDLPFIIVSGTIGEDVAVQSMRAGASDYLIKGNLVRLVPAVRRELREAASRRQGRQTAQALQESEHLFLALNASSLLGIFFTDLAGQVTYANPRQREVLGLTLGESVGSGWMRAIDPEDRQRVEQGWWSFVSTGEGEFAVECRVHSRQETTRWVQVRAVRMPDVEGGTGGYVGTVEDITERKQTEEQAWRAQKMEAVGRLAGGVAHDFNNILTAIAGYSDLLVRQVIADGPGHGYVDEIRKAAERAAGLTRQLLAFSRRQVLEPKVLDLNALVTDMTKMLQRLIGEDVELVVALAPALGRVKADPGQIEQVVMNLVVNARDAMPDGGRLTIQTANVTRAECGSTLHPDVSPGEYVMVAVQDTGTGMTDEVRGRIFEPFFTTKGEGKGTGLGLATTYGIVQQSNGQITVQTQLGAGTAFRVYLPVTAEAALPAVVPREQQKSQGSGETVLLVEDEEAVRELSALVLREAGYQVIEAINGQAALEVAQRRTVAVDIVVTDVVMPVMGGRQLAEALRRAHPRLKVLFTSGYTEDAILKRGVREAGVEFLQKPFTATTLARRVREVLDRVDSGAA